MTKEKLRLKLACRIERPSRCGLSYFGHVRFHGRIEGFDEPTQKWMWQCSSETFEGLYLKSLEISNQCDDDSHDASSYAWEVSYRKLLSVDIREAGRMYKTLTTIEKRMEKIKAEFGYPATYGQFVARAAVAMKAQSIIFYRERDGQDIGEIELGPGESVSRIDRDVTEVGNQCREMAGKEKIAA